MLSSNASRLGSTGVGRMSKAMLIRGKLDRQHGAASVEIMVTLGAVASETGA
jgi:hypothetical protein